MYDIKWGDLSRYHMDDADLLAGAVPTVVLMQNAAALDQFRLFVRNELQRVNPVRQSGPSLVS